MTTTTYFLEKEPVRDQRRTVEFELVHRVQRGDQEAFRELVERHQNRIFSLVYRTLRNREDAEDVAQGVFTRVYFAIQSFDGHNSLLTWIYKIAINECYSHFRKRRHELSNQVDAPGCEEFGAARQSGVDNTTAARDFLNKLLAHIGEEDRLLLVLKETQGHSIAELAQMTGTSMSAIKTKLFRARRKLLEAASRLAHRPLLALSVPGRASL
jgi:RNA polymerase sigma-70 factor (ECF subfamily)